MQQDIVLRIPLCNAEQIAACPSKLSEHKIYQVDGADHISSSERLVCEVAVPGACPRITCQEKACRLLGLIQTQQNESGFWMKLPCGSCGEVRDLSTETKGFVFNG